jgi:pilus assembly protein FimV
VATALKSITAAVASAVFLTSAATAAGLGKLTVLSALGQPLRAEIELTAGAGEDPASMAVKLASPEAFRAANIEFNPALLSLRFAVEERGGRQVIRVSSTQPLNEPFVDMLLELNWNNGRLVREYTFLLDPAELRTTQPAQVAAAPQNRPAAPRASATPATPTAPAAAAPAEEARIAAARRGAERQAREAQAREAQDSYRVRRGDTLSGIALDIKPADISLDMMLVALYRANPDAFIGNNMNRLKSGQILSIPDADSVRGGASQGEARGVVVAHAADFDAYRNKLAGQVASSAPSATPQGGQSASGRVTARVEQQPTAVSEAQDKLQLSKATPGAAGAPADGTASVEDTVAKERELAQAEARVKELERNVNELENLMTVPSRGGAEAEQAAAAAAATAAAEKPAAKPAPRPRPAKPAPPPEKSFADTILDNMLYIGAGALVLLLAALGISQRRKRNAQAVKPPPAEPSVLGVPGASAHSLFAESGGQSVDTNNSVFNSSFAPSASQLDTNEVDPVAEADVYIAYGRDAQAEEILKEALRVHPERHPVRLKLLEIYATRKDVRAFEAQARELHAFTGGQGDEWAQAAALGLTLDPTNPLYENAAPASSATPSPQERNQQAILSQQFEDAFRGGPSVGAGAAAGAAAGIAAGAGAMALAKDDEDRTAAPQADLAPDERTETRNDDNTLDFDLGGLTFEPVTNADAPPAASRPDPDATAVPDLEFDMAPFAPPGNAPEQAKAAPDANDLDFDMDFDAPATAQPTATAATIDDDDDDFTLDLSPQSQVQATPVDMAGLAKDFDGLPPLPGSTPQPTVAQADPLRDLDAMDFSAPTTPVTPAAPGFDEAPARPAPASPSEDPLFDLDSMDFGTPDEARPAGGAEPKDFGARVDDPFDMFDLPETPAPVPAPQEVSARDAFEPASAPADGKAAPSFDLVDFDLDLSPEPATAQPLDAADASAEAPGQMSPEHMEMETKLDLAIAYQEIGDKEGARELLDEVIKGGNTEQVGKASAMRELLA